ncbi:MAG: VOC family protein [Bacteroidota bacterium]
MKQELWLNLPVKDLAKTKNFFTALGFESLRDAPDMVGFNIGNVPVMMVAVAEFEKYTANSVADPSQGSEVLISVDAPDRAYVDDMVGKVTSAGGTVFSQPTELQGWMYTMGFVDLDGHRWNILHMDHETTGK